MKYIVPLFVLCLFLSCGKNPTQGDVSKRRVYKSYLNRNIFYDTIYIKEIPHEFIITKVYGGCTVVHSPECPCIKIKED